MLTSKGIFHLNINQNENLIIDLFKPDGAFMNALLSSRKDYEFIYTIDTSMLTPSLQKSIERKEASKIPALYRKKNISQSTNNGQPSVFMSILI